MPVGCHAPEFSWEDALVRTHVEAVRISPQSEGEEQHQVVVGLRAIAYRRAAMSCQVSDQLIPVARSVPSHA
jgi:hypothetical protein